jgi:hypothetical protein
MSVVVNILAAIGLIVIITYIIYYLYKYIKKRMDYQIAAEMNPPGNYMQNTGLRCPDYWVNTGIDANGNYICKNSFNILTNQDEQCNATQLSFPPLPAGQTWEYGNPNGLTSMSDSDKYNFLNNNAVAGSISRCQWINKCGPARNTQGIWSGVNEICNNPQLGK